MSALAMAVLLIGSGPVQPAKPPRPAPVPRPPTLNAPSPPPAAGIAQPARRERPPASYFTGEDWPAATERPGRGTVGFRLTIDPNGRVSDCMITLSSGYFSLDQTTCRILRSRARYTPARDAAGNPTTGSDLGRVIWRVHDEIETPTAQQPAPNLCPDRTP